MRTQGNKTRKTPLFILLFLLTVLSASGADKHHEPVRLKARVHTTFRFIAYGDTRFTNPADKGAANAEVRQRLVRALADAHPDFITFGGDITYNGNNSADWTVYDQETAIWRDRKIPVYPALGNHDLHKGPNGDEQDALQNYFSRFPILRESRFYSVRAANTEMLTLDSSLDEVSGPQGDWLKAELDHIPRGVDFVFVVLHHPPYSSSSDDKALGGGHNARPKEQQLAAFLEERQKTLRPRLIVFAGHVHNYERHEHGGVIYFVSGGGGAHAYPINRAPDDLFQSKEINYHYLMVAVRPRELTITMNRLELKDGEAQWTQPDSVTIHAVAK